MIPQVAAQIARLMTRARHRRFLASLNRPDAAQARVRARIERALPQCEYGRRFSARLADLPIVRHEDLAQPIARMRAGARDVLWPGGVDHWMTTSGSGGPKKLVPITPALKRVFASALAVWAHDILTHLYRPRTGKLFMALAPPGDQALTHEVSFLGPLAPLARAFLVAPRELQSAREPMGFRRALAAALTAEPKLEVISLWSPTYLLALMDLVEAERGRRLDWAAMWPELKFVSAWDAAAAAAPARELMRRLPHARFQGKGLIATEAPLTIPRHDAPAPVPVLDEIFFEFRDAAGAIHPLTDIRDGETYALICSAPGGFLRYDIGDLVRVAGRAGAAPCLAFAGRADAVSDLVGEKLSEEVATQALAGRAGVLVPVAAPPHYVLLAETENDAAAVETALMEGHHYARARELGQLGPVRAVAVPNLRARLLAAAEADGQNMDSIKDRALIHDLRRAAALLRRLNDPLSPSP